jgi:hypothetical protein
MSAVDVPKDEWPCLDKRHTFRADAGICRCRRMTRGVPTSVPEVVLYWPTIRRDDDDIAAVVKAARAFLAAAALEAMTKAPKYIAAKRRLRAALERLPSEPER